MPRRIRNTRRGVNRPDPDDLERIRLAQLLDDVSTALEPIVQADITDVSATADEVNLLDISLQGVVAGQALLADSPTTASWQNLGATGGASLAAQYRFDTSIVEADPGNGDFRMDNAIPASVTELFVSSTTDNGNDFNTILSLVGVGDQVYIQQDNDATKFVLLNVTANVDNTGWWSIAGTIAASGTIFDNNAKCHILILLGGSGAFGDVFKVGTPVNNEIGVWTGDGTIEGDPSFLWDGQNLTLSDTFMSLTFTEVGASANNANWAWQVSGEDMQLELYNDLFSASNSIIDITRSLNVGIRMDFDFIDIVSTGRIVATTFRPTFTYNNLGIAEFANDAIMGAVIVGTGSTADFSMRNSDNNLVMQNFTGTLNVDFRGDITSLGLLVEAPYRVLQMESDGTTATFGNVADQFFNFKMVHDNEIFSFSSGPVTSQGAVFRMRGAGAGDAGDTEFISSNSKWFWWDESSGGMKFAIGSGGGKQQAAFFTNTKQFGLLGELKSYITTDATSGATGTIHTLGGIGVTKDVWVGGTLIANGLTAAGDNSALGYSATLGAILTGQGSTNDVTIKNDVDANVIEIPTGTVNVNLLGNVAITGILTTGTTQVGLETTANLEDIAHVVNTGDQKTQGTMLFNSNTQNPVYAIGSAAGSVWVDGAGTTVHTPV